MQRTFEVFKHSADGYAAVKRGFSWPAFFFSWIWAFRHRLWIQGIVLLALITGMGLLFLFLLPEQRSLNILFGFGLSVPIGLMGNRWRSQKLQHDGWAYLGALIARSPDDAVHRVARTGGIIPDDWKIAPPAFRSFGLPISLQRIVAVAKLTVKAAFRFRLFPLMAAMTLAIVIGLPLIIVDDGTARGMIQIVITYTLGFVTTILGFATLWLACGTLARDIEECQMQMIDVKPIARWQVWLGKWLGIMWLNALLLTMTGFALHALVKHRSARLPAAQQTILRNELLVARDSAHPDAPDIDRFTEEEVRERTKDVRLSPTDLEEVRKQVKERIKAEVQSVAPRYRRRWIIDLSRVQSRLKDQPVYLRVKFGTANYNPQPTPYVTAWEIGPADSPYRQRILQPLTSDTFHEIEVEPNKLDQEGRLVVDFGNVTDKVFVFPSDEAMEVLYREAGFATNLFRGLLILFCWLGLLAALGLAAASFLSFPVAAFTALTVLCIGLSSGTLATVVKEGSVMRGYSGASNPDFVDRVFMPLIKALVKACDLVLGFSPIDSLSTGRSVTWGQLGLAFAQIWLLAGGLLSLFGIAAFTRRELATAASTQ